MRKRLSARCVAATMVAVVVLAQQETAAATPQPPAALYTRAWQAVRQAPRFSMSMRTYYGALPVVYTTRVRSIAPDRLYASSFEGPDLGTTVYVQVGLVVCNWNVGAPFRRIFCGDVAGLARRLRESRLQNSMPLRANHPSVWIVQMRQPSGITILAIRGEARISLCPPGDSCGYFPMVPMAYEARLTIARSSGLPLSFSSHVVKQGRIVWRQTATYTYNHSFGIALPTGPRITCPNWVPRDQWCLAQRR